MLVVAQWVWTEEMDRYREGLFKEKKFGCQGSKENGAA